MRSGATVKLQDGVKGPKAHRGSIRIIRGIACIGVALLIKAAAVVQCGAEAQDKAADVPRLLEQARLTHDPTSIILRVVSLLDQELDGHPETKDSWMQLGEALAIGFARSRHAASASAAWRRAYELDTGDCHVGALAARSSNGSQSERWILDLEEHHPKCAEAVYLRALISGINDPARVEMLQMSLHIKQSTEAYVALGQALVAAHRWKEAERAYASALVSPPMFLEDWRPDGWVAVHAHLGLAWVFYHGKKMQGARREYAKFMRWFCDPGPWHDLNEAEELWRVTLAARWPGITDVPRK